MIEAVSSKISALVPYTTDSSKKVSTRHPEYTAMLASWAMMYDVCISERYIQGKSQTYLPRLDEMTDGQYLAYTRRAEFPMFTKHALDSFVGMAMRKELLIEGIDTNHPFFKNTDGRGSSVKSYAEKLVRNFLQYRRCGTLVEMPSTDPNQSLADAESQNVNARLAFYDYASILNWKTSTQNNVNILTLVVLEEEEDVSVNEFEHEYEARYRVLRLENGVYRQEIYDDSGQLIATVVPLKKNKPLNFIPFVIHGGVPVSSPIMLPIAEQNIHWYMKDADYQHGLHYTALPTPWVVGVDPKDEMAPKTIGPQRLWYLPMGSTCGMLEFTGAGLKEIKSSMDATMHNITMLSSQILVPKSAYDETATAASIRSASETASLSSMVSDLSEELTTVIKVASDWGNFSHKDTSIEINSDFMPLTLSGADVSAYVSAVIKEGFSKKTLFDLLKKGEIIEGSRQFKDEMDDIEAEARARMDREVELADRLSSIEAKISKLYTQNPDSKSKKGQDSASEQSANSKSKNASK